VEILSPEAGVSADRLPAATSRIAYGEGGRFDELDDSGAITAFGKWEGGYEAEHLATTTALGVFLQDIQDEEQINRLALQVTMYQGDPYGPLVDFRPGDSIDWQIPAIQTTVTRPVRTISWEQGETAKYEVSGSKVFDDETGLARAVEFLLDEIKPRDLALRRGAVGESAAGGSWPTILVAASDASENVKTLARSSGGFVCTGTNDHVVIQEALDLLPYTDVFGTGPNGRVQLSEGNFYLNGSSGTLLSTQGSPAANTTGGVLEGISPVSTILWVDSGFAGTAIANSSRGEVRRLAIMEQSTVSQLWTGISMTLGHARVSDVEIVDALIGWEFVRHGHQVSDCTFRWSGSGAGTAIRFLTSLVASASVTNLNAAGHDIEFNGNAENIVMAGVVARRVFGTGGPFNVSMTAMTLGDTVNDYSLDLTGGSQIYFDGIISDDSVTDVGGIHLDSVAAFSLNGIVQRARTHGVWLDDCDSGTVDILVRGASWTVDDTYDAFFLDGTTEEVNVYGRYDWASPTEPNRVRYIVNVGASADDIKVDVGYNPGTGRTGDLNNAAGLESVWMPWSSMETPTEGDVLVWDDSEDKYRPSSAAGAPSPIAGIRGFYVLSKEGVLPSAPALGVMEIPFTIAATIIQVRARLQTAPTGADVILDINKNGTSMYLTATNPTIAAGANDSGNAVPDATTMAAGDYLSVDIDQIGSTIAGSNLVVVIEWEA
jgi:hypothetical protein